MNMHDDTTYIVVRYDVPTKQLRRIAETFGLPPTATSTAIKARLREFLQVQGDQVLVTLTMPLMARLTAAKTPRRQATSKTARRSVRA
jgi:Mg2+ and Co2+ transporter CorA